MVRPGLGAEDSAHRGHVQAGAGTVHHPVKQLLHLGAAAKQQVAAVFDLLDRVGVAQSRCVAARRDPEQSTDTRCRSTGHKT